MAGFEVDEWGNSWAGNDAEKKHPLRPHPELGKRGTCVRCGVHYWRTRNANGDFEWRCDCGVVEGLHH